MISDSDNERNASSGSSSLSSKLDLPPLPVEDDQEQIVSKPSKLLYIAALVGLCGAISMGTCLGWSSPSLSDMADQNPEILTTDPYTRSFIGSSTNLGGIFGGMLAGSLANYLGRRTLVVMIAVPFLAGWFPIIFGATTAAVLAGRILTGFCAAILSSVVVSLQLFTADAMLDLSFAADLHLRGGPDEHSRHAWHHVSAPLLRRDSS